MVEIRHKDSDAVLRRVRAASLEGASLARVDLRGADLRERNLRGANLRGARLGGAELLAAIYSEETHWPDGYDPAAHGARCLPQNGARGRAA